MARHSRIHEDTIVRDLQQIRRLRWSRPSEFERLECLLDHPVIVHAAGGSEELSRRVTALKDTLRRTLRRIRAREPNDVPHNRSVAFAGTALLRLEKQFEDETVNAIRERIAAEWGSKRDREHITPDGFRQYLEVEEVYEPIASEFRELARDQAVAAGFAIDDPEMNGASHAPSELRDMRTALGRIGRGVWDMEITSHHRRLGSIRDGTLLIRDEEEMFGILDLLIDSARHGMQAVDHIEISKWFTSPRLSNYLSRQRARVVGDGLALERIRFVDRVELEDRRTRRQIASFVALHDEIAATVLLCPIEAAEDLKTAFHPRTGLFMTDPDDEPAAVSGWGGGGPSEQTTLHTRDTEALRRLRSDYDALRTYATTCDDELRDAVTR